MMSNGLISGVLVTCGLRSMRLEAHVGPDLHRRNRGQISHAHQIVGGAGESENPVHFANSAMPNLSQERNRLQPAEAFFDALPLSLADRVSRVPRGAAINRAAAGSSQVLRHVRRHPQMAALRHKPTRVEAFVAAYRQRL